MSAVGDWEGLSGHYARQHVLQWRAVQRAAQLADPRPGELLVDVGCGTGLLLRALLVVPVRPTAVLAVDPTPGMLAQLPTLPDGWSAVEAHGHAVPLLKGAADVVVCSYLLHVLEADERHRVLRETRRILRKGGRIVTVTPHAPQRAGRLALDALARRPELAGLRTHDPREDLAAAGFRVERAEQHRRGYPSLLVRARR